MIKREKLIKKIFNIQLFRFLVVGTSTVLVDLIVYSFLLKLSLNISASKLIGFSSGTLYSYNLNKSWTFHSSLKYKEKLLKYILLYLSSMYLNIQINSKLLIILTTDESTSYKLAFLVATTCSAMINYLGMKYLVF